MCRHGVNMRLRGTQNGCAACGEVFWTLTDFDRHQEHHPGTGIFNGMCRNPGEIGLAWFSGAWGTPEGNAVREVKSERIARLHRATSCTETRSHGSGYTERGGTPGGL